MSIAGMDSSSCRGRPIGRLTSPGVALQVLLLACGLNVIEPTQARSAVWFAKAKSTGDGKELSTPIGSLAALEAVAKPRDVIMLLPGDAPFDGGLTLKPGQTLIGLPGDRKPSITNTSVERNGGNGLVLADGCQIIGVRIERTKASGVLGVDVTGVSLIDVDMDDANQSAGLTTTEVGLLGPISHAGVLFISTQSGKKAENRLLRCNINRAAGLGVGAFALKGANSRLIVDHARSEGGPPSSPLFDVGVMAFAEGKGSEAHLELADAVVGGRMSQQGRNVLVFASADARARARIERTTTGASGQDGVVGVASRVPATVEIEIRDSTLEKAAQMNLEGSILNLPPSDPTRAHEGLVSIDVRGSVLRDVGFVDGFRGEAQNIWLAPSVIEKGPFAKGRYRLSVRNSTVEKALKTGIGVGNVGEEFGIAPDEGDYDVILTENTIRNNGPSDVTIAASNARVDARRNDWGVATGLADSRVVLLGKAKRSQLDATQPLSPRPDEPR